MSEKDSQDFQNKSKRQPHARSVADVLGKVLEPILARRTGMTLDLVRAWPEICGPEFANTTRPLKIDWPRRANEDDPFEPASLIVACEPAAALFFQHEQAAIIERVNLFFGFTAIKRMRIQQKPVAEIAELKPIKSAQLSPIEESRLQNLLVDITDPALREKLENLGRGIIIAERN